MAREQYPQLKSTNSTIQIPLKTSYTEELKKKTKHYFAIAFGVVTLGLGPLVGNFLASRKAAKTEAQSPAPLVQVVEAPKVERPPVIKNMQSGTFKNINAQTAAVPQQTAQPSQTAVQPTPQPAPQLKALPPVTLVSVSATKLYETQKDLLELNEGKELTFYRLDGKVHVGIGCNVQDNPHIAKDIKLKIYKQMGNKKVPLDDAEFKKFFEQLTTLSDTELKKYSIENDEAYRLLKATHADFYTEATSIFKRLGVNFSKLPVGIQIGIMDTIFRVGKNSFRKGFPNAKGKIQELAKLTADSNQYEQTYFDVLRELSLGVTDAKTNSYKDKTSARRAMRAWYIGLAEIGNQKSGFLGLARGADVDSVIKYLAQNPIPSTHFNGFAGNKVEQNAAIQRAFPLIQAYHPSLTRENFLAKLKSFRTPQKPVKQKTL